MLLLIWEELLELSRKLLKSEGVDFDGLAIKLVVLNIFPTA